MASKGVCAGLMVLAALSLFAVEASAQELSAQLRVSSQRVYKGQVFICKVIVKGAKADAEPQFPKSKDWTWDYEGSQDGSTFFRSEVNGRVTERVTKKFIYQYTCYAKRVGSITMPAASLKIKGRAMSTNVVPMVVQEPTETPNFKLRLRATKPRVYLGEPFRVITTFYVNKQFRDYDFQLPSADSYDSFRPQQESMTREQMRQRKVIVKEIDGEKVQMQVGQNKLEGQEYTTLSFERIVVPKAAGRLSYGPTYLKVVTADNQFLLIPSNTLSVTVRELPKSPPGFTGMVGRCQLQVTAKPSTVRVGDPITYQVAIKVAEEPVGRVPMPDLQKQALAKDFRVSKPDSEPKLEAGLVKQTWTLRAKRDSVEAIPAVSLVFFNAQSGQYETVTSQALPLTVEASREVVLEKPVNQARAPERQDLKSLDLGVSHNYQDSSILVNQQFRWSVALLSVSQALASLPLLLALLLFLSRRKEQILGAFAGAPSTAFVEAQASLNEARGLTAEAQAQAVLTAFQKWTGHCFQCPAEALTAKDVEQRWRGRLSEQAAASLTELLRDCSAIRFGQQPSSDSLVESAGKVLGALREEVGQ